MRQKKGISLIVLVVTIIVMIIIAGAIIISLNNTNVIDMGEQAVQKHNEQSIEEAINLAYQDLMVTNLGKVSTDVVVERLQTLSQTYPEIENINAGYDRVFYSLNITGKYYQLSTLTGTITEYAPITNPEEDPSAWDIAYAYNNSTWTKLTGGGNVEGQIVAKLYKKNVPVDAGVIYMDGWATKVDVSAKEYSYRMVIEGNGDMPELGNLNEMIFSGWQEEIVEVFTILNAENCIMPYVTEIVVCDGITSIGAWSLAGATSLEKITLPNTITKINTYAFANTDLQNGIVIPEGVTEIGEGAFSCTYIPEVRLPESVIVIGKNGFRFNNMLSRIYIETKSDNFTVGEYGFDDILEDAIIYVRNPEIAEKVKKETNATISTEYNWKYTNNK